MKLTEPFTNEYYMLDHEGIMRDTQFVNVTMKMTDPRYRTITATIPHASWPIHVNFLK